MESNAFARLRRVAGKQTTRLTLYGRKAGKPHEVTIWECARERLCLQRIGAHPCGYIEIAKLLRNGER